VKLAISPQAAADMEAAATWWYANRPAAPLLFERELRQALELISATPNAGSPLRSLKLAGVRRVPLPRTRYLIYYRTFEDRHEVRVLRLWHVSRRGRPRL
jgi:plasmid stabilization system protein ParE